MALSLCNEQSYFRGVIYEHEYEHRDLRRMPDFQQCVIIFLCFSVPLNSLAINWGFLYMIAHEQFVFLYLTAHE